LIDALRAELGEDRMKKLLAKVGREMGAEVAKELEHANRIEKWTAREFEDVFVKKYLKDVGAEPEIVERTDKKVVYRLYNCIFSELSMKMPELMCDVLHREFHYGVSSVMGKNVRDSQRTCMGHGADYCEHVIEWS
jgi:predicted hydrocarbon binding protein